MQQLSAAIINLGCKVNKYEADSMKDKLLEAGVMVVSPEDVADVYIVNTCSVTNMAQKKSRQMLRRAKRRNPEAVIVAAGCYVNAEHDNVKQEEFVDIVVGNNCKKDIVQEIFSFLESKSQNDYYVDVNQTKEYEEMGHLQASHLDHQRAYIKIQDGCNQFCSYCIIPYTRGRVRSREPKYILDEITTLAKNGVKEFVLTGIHISSYGIDFAKKEVDYDTIMDGIGEREEIGLGELVAMIAQIPEVERIRLGSLEPRIVTDSFLEMISRTEKICPHFHLSLQSGCNETLKRMNRKYTIEEFEEKCTLIRTYFDRPAITTDVIVGFPGETEEEFAITMESLQRIALYEIHVFKYSVRAGTVAERLPNQVPEAIKGIRSEALLALTAMQKQEYEKQFYGTKQEVLIEECLAEHEKEEDGIAIEAVLNMDEENPSKSKQWYVGHTKQYIKVKVASSKDIVNQVLEVTLGNEQETCN